MVSCHEILKSLNLKREDEIIIINYLEALAFIGIEYLNNKENKEFEHEYE